MKVGLIGCGNISGSYLGHAAMFPGVEMVAVADVVPAAAEARATEFGLRALSVDALLADPEVELVVNLTIPETHAAVSRAILEAGKHVYSEKPLVLSVEDGQALRELAAARGRQVGCAPDTWLGGAHQLARRLVDEGAVGRIVHGTAHVLGPGMQGWHPNPDFFFREGGGPVLDMGAYYIAQLVNLIGPVARVSAMAARAGDTRTIGSGPRKGEEVPVEVDTTVHATLGFASGAVVTFGASWDVAHSDHPNMELYGTQGTLALPDPNFFGGGVVVRTDPGDPDRQDMAPADDHPLSRPNRVLNDGRHMADYRGIGLADMIDAIATGREARCSLDRALHAVDVMTAILRAARDGGVVEIAQTCTRPAPLGAAEAAGLMAPG